MMNETHTTKVCTCCKRALDFAALPLLGWQFFDDDAGQWFGLELKNCECGSTQCLEPVAVSADFVTETEAKQRIARAA